MNEEKVKVKMMLCKTCKNAIRVSVEHTMDDETIEDYTKAEIEGTYIVQTMPLNEYEKSSIKMYCNDDCSQKKHYKIFEFFKNEHDLTLTNSEIDDIINIIVKQ